MRLELGIVTSTEEEAVKAATTIARTEGYPRIEIIHQLRRQVVAKEVVYGRGRGYAAATATAVDDNVVVRASKKNAVVPTVSRSIEFAIKYRTKKNRGSMTTAAAAACAAVLIEYINYTLGKSFAVQEEGSRRSLQLLYIVRGKKRGLKAKQQW